MEKQEKLDLIELVIFELGDKLQRISSPRNEINNDLTFKVVWKVKKSGFKPIDSRISSSIIRNFYPEALIDFYQEKIKFEPLINTVEKRKRENSLCNCLNKKSSSLNKKFDNNLNFCFENNQKKKINQNYLLSLNDEENFSRIFIE